MDSENGARMARVMADMLLDAWPINPVTLRRALRYAVSERYGTGASCWRDLAYELNGFVRNAYLLCRKESSAISSTQRWCRDACSAGERQLPIERYVLLTTLLFGSLHTLKAMCKSQEMGGASSALARVDSWVEDSIKGVTATDLRTTLQRNGGSFWKTHVAMGITSRRFLRLLAIKCPDVLGESIPAKHRPKTDQVRRLFSEGLPLRLIIRRTNITMDSIIKITAGHPDCHFARADALKVAKVGVDSSTRKEHLDGCALKQSEVPRWKSRLLADPAIDWEVRDEEWSCQVQGAVEDLIDKQLHRIFRIRPSTVVAHLKWALPSGFPHMSVRLPKTRLALDRHCESRMAYKFRRVVWWIRKTSMPGEPLPTRTICQSSGISPRDLPGYLWLTGFGAHAS